MTGWNISVYRQEADGSAPAKEHAEGGARLAVWQTGLEGLSWIRDLVGSKQAIDLGGDGYPNKYTAQAKHLLPRVLDGPPLAHKVWIHDVGDILTDAWKGKTVIDRKAAVQCRPDEWLLIEAWDES